jgi:hypothetical protein
MTKIVTGKREDIINVAVQNGMTREEATKRLEAIKYKPRLPSMLDRIWGWVYE